MKVLFSNPPFWQKVTDTKSNIVTGIRAGSQWPTILRARFSMPDKWTFGDPCPYPFFMGYAASYIQKNSSAQVFFRDSIALRESYKSWMSYIKKTQPDFLVLESASTLWGHDRRLILQLNKIFPKLRIILTGTIAIQAEKIGTDISLVACVKGEYEKGVLRVLNGAKGILNHELLTEEEMNQAPFPWYDNDHAHLYWDETLKGHQAPQAQVWSSRGCPHKCIFCVWPASMTGNDPDGTQKRFIRYYSQEYMESFLGELVGRYGYKSLHFGDSIFNASDEHVHNMCAVMRKINIPWTAVCRAGGIQLDTWTEMKRSGCFGIHVGIESGSQYVLDRVIQKKLDLEEIHETVEHIKKINMQIHGNMVYGLPGESLVQNIHSKKFIVSLGLDRFSEENAVSIEGTPLHTFLNKDLPIPSYKGVHKAHLPYWIKDGHILTEPLSEDTYYPHKHLFFHHMVSTGGNSLANILSNLSPTYKKHQITQSVIPKVGDETVLQTAKESTLFYGHNLFGLMEKAGIHDRYFTTLRHPFDRIISDYFWLLNFNPDMTARKALTTFIKFVDECDHLEFYIHHLGHLNWENRQHFDPIECSKIDNDRAYDMAIHNIETKFWFVGIMEMFDETIFYISDRLNLSKPPDDYRKVSLSTKYRPSFWELPLHTQKQIEKKTRFDQNLYHRCRAQFEDSVQYLYEKNYFIRHFNITHPVEPGSPSPRASKKNKE